ncbi:MAG: asparagine synthase-related protein [Anaerolineae bacterium]|nr:asparagine synthase-related protein [Anaerolineae bacterium]
MANFVVIIDPDIERQSRFIEKIRPLIPLVEGLVTNTCAMGEFYAIWASNERAPVSYVADDQGTAVLWGEAINGPGSERITAAQLRERWQNLPDDLPDALDGFYAAVVYQPKVGVVVGADLLGLFPVYYYSRGEILLVGSSPELFRCHPEFRQEFNPAGLVGMLLLMHIFEGQTLLREVRRLAAGHLLGWQPGQAVREIKQYQIPLSTRYYDLSFRAHVDILEQAVDEAVRRHAPANRRYGLLLSGGLDSRMLGGFLQRNDVDVVALTLGLPTDIEMKCAVPVARTLNFEHRAVNISTEQYPICSRTQVQWEHGANGFNFVMNWGVYSYLSELGPYVVLGYIMDAILGGPLIHYTYSKHSPHITFDKIFTFYNNWGIKLDLLKKLLRRELFGDLVEETVARIRTLYESYAEFDSSRAWFFELYHRQRFHVGGAAWALSFGAWPILPAIDRQVLEIVGAIPSATIVERRAQKELLCTKFPALAKLPLDRNSYQPEPLQPRLRYLLTQSLKQQLKVPRSLERLVKSRQVERRYYYRISDFNGPGWLAVRRQAEPYRERVLHLFNGDVLAEILPPPHVTVEFKRDGIVEASGLKLLLGFLLWSKEHLEGF